MKTSTIAVVAILAALFIAGCQEQPIEPQAADRSLNDPSVSDAAAIGLIEAEIAATEHEGWTTNRNFIGILSAREEVPPTDSRGRGVVKFRVAKDGQSISYKLIVANISNVVGAHVHLGPEGGNGPVVFGLYSHAAGGGRICGPIAEGSFTPADLVGPYAGSADFSLFLSDLHADSLYVNVHTSDGVDSTSGTRGDYPAGEIRGQLNGHRPHGNHDRDRDDKKDKKEKNDRHDGRRNDDDDRSGRHGG